MPPPLPPPKPPCICYRLLLFCLFIPRPPPPRPPPRPIPPPRRDPVEVVVLLAYRLITPPIAPMAVATPDEIAAGTDAVSFTGLSGTSMIAPFLQTPAHVPQPVQLSILIFAVSAVMVIARTGHTFTHNPHPMQSDSSILYFISSALRSSS